jgi:hypothetical protein
MASKQIYHTAVLLKDGRVLVAGNGAELYDPASQSWIESGEMIPQE